MYILKEITRDCEGYYNIEEPIAVSENKDLLIEYHKNKLNGYLLPEGSYFREWCKANGKDYYRESNYYTLGEIELLK